MAGLSSELYQQCRGILLKCSEFDRDASLRAMFVTQELGPFKTRLPEASNKNERVDVTLDYLISKRLNDGRPVLPLFLAALRDRYQLGDALRDELETLARKTHSALGISGIGERVARNTAVQSPSQTFQQPVVVKTPSNKTWVLENGTLHEPPDGPTHRELRKRFEVRRISDEEASQYPEGEKYPSIVPRVVQDEHKRFYLATYKTPISKGSKREIDERVVDYLTDGRGASPVSTTELANLTSLPPLSADVMNRFLESRFFFTKGRGDETYLLKYPFIRWIPSSKILRELDRHLDIGQPDPVSDSKLDSYTLGPSISKQPPDYGIQHLKKWKAKEASIEPVRAESEQIETEPAPRQDESRPASGSGGAVSDDKPLQKDRPSFRQWGLPIFFLLGFVLALVIVSVYWHPLRCALEYRLNDALAALLVALIGGIFAVLAKLMTKPVLRYIWVFCSGVALWIVLFVVTGLILPPILEQECWPPPLPTPTNTATPTFTPTSMLTPTITITSPLSEVVCRLGEECRFNISGTSSGIAPGQQVIVFVRDWDQWFPHKLFSIEIDGNWQGQAQVGDAPCIPAGKRFDIKAVVLTQADADEIPMEFQPLPENAVAQSSQVTLVTKYNSIPVDVSEATSECDLRGIDAITMTLVSSRSLAFDYNLGGGWVQSLVTLSNSDLSCAKELGFSIVFSLEGSGASNTFEVKLEDTDSTICAWRRGSVTAGLEAIEWPLNRPFDACWSKDGSGDTEMNWQGVRSILFAVSQLPGNRGGAGHVGINEVVLVSPP